VLEHAGHAVAEAPSGDRAVEMLDERRFDVVLLDLAMPGMHGLDALERIREIAPDTGVIVVSGEATLANAMRAGQRGAFDFIEKPPDRERLLDVVVQAAQITELRRISGTRTGTDLGIVGSSPAIAALVDGVRRIAPSQGRVLITGENGTGKELVAQAIHLLSKRAAGPFVKINCAAIPKDLVESELFGYERGAFTGAVQNKRGRLELADHGTLFLDEIGDLALVGQAKLLRALEEHRFERVGGNEPIEVNFRLISATNRPLDQFVRDARFREDLYYRVNAFSIRLPSLKERATDIPVLASRFLARYCAANGLPLDGKTFAREAIELLLRYSWPGNIRELESTVSRAALSAPGRVIRAADVDFLHADRQPADAARQQLPTLAEAERTHITRVLDAVRWNKKRAASVLDISRGTLYRKIVEYGLHTPPRGAPDGAEAGENLRD
jgi:DNA-binding NtrC family response regulator